MADVLQPLTRSLLDLRVASLAFVIALALAAFHAPPATASLAFLECEACTGCSPGTNPLPDADCQECQDNPPHPDYLYCSCCEGVDEQAHCCWSVPN